MITTNDPCATLSKVSDLYGLSTDTKPTNVGNASTFYEMDTSTLYMFDAENQVWLAQGGSN